jgi:hypothetical protein
MYLELRCHKRRRLCDSKDIAVVEGKFELARLMIMTCIAVGDATDKEILGWDEATQ